MNDAKKLIEAYYLSFNQQDMNTFLSYLDENVLHDINQGKREVGIAKFKEFMERMNASYLEQVHHLRILINEDGSLAAAEFTIKGKYLKTDKGLPEAHGQTYELPCGAFFEIKNGKITRITNYYNLNDWLAQVKNWN